MRGDRLTEDVASSMARELDKRSHRNSKFLHPIGPAQVWQVNDKRSSDHIGASPAKQANPGDGRTPGRDQVVDQQNALA
jgi:hypothetical protein